MSEPESDLEIAVRKSLTEEGQLKVRESILEEAKREKLAWYVAKYAAIALPVVGIGVTAKMFSMVADSSFYSSLSTGLSSLAMMIAMKDGWGLFLRDANKGIEYSNRRIEEYRNRIKEIT